MAEGTYEYECMRAELLGIEKPDYDEFMRKKQETAALPREEEEIETEGEQMKRISGGLDELNSILQVTQRKINRFKASCGSLTNLLKIKIGHGSSTDSLEVASNEEASLTPAPVPPPPVGTVATNGHCGNSSTDEGERKSDLAKALDNHLDKLDIMIDKAENAQYSMAHQNKEMKRFLN